MSRYMCVRAVHSDYWMQIQRSPSFCDCGSSSGRPVIEMSGNLLDGRDSILSWGENFKLRWKIILFETANWLLSVRLSSKNMSIVSDSFDQTQIKSSLHETINGLSSLSHQPFRLFFLILCRTLAKCCGEIHIFSHIFTIKSSLRKAINRSCQLLIKLTQLLLKFNVADFYNFVLHDLYL